MWRNNPLPFHNNADAGRRWPPMAARAAGQVLGDARQAVRGTSGPRLRRRSRSSPGRSGSTWRSSRTRSTRRKSRIASRATWPTADSFGARGTPTFFINGQSSAARSRSRRSRRSSTRRLRKADADASSGTSRGRFLCRAHQERQGQGGRAAAGARRPASPIPTPRYPRRGRGRADEAATRTRRSPSSSGRTSSARSAAASSRPSTSLIKDYRTRCASSGAPAAAVPPARCRPRSGARRRGAGQVLGDARHAVTTTSRRSTCRARFEKTRRVGLNIEQVQGGARLASKDKQTIDADSPAGSQDRRHRHAGLFVNGKTSAARSRSRRSRPVDEELKIA